MLTNFPYHIFAVCKYNPNKKTKQNKTEKRNIIWLNAPYSKNVVTKVGHHFLKLFDKQFSRQLKLQEIFNKNTVRYSCTNNIKSIINSQFYIKFDNVQTKESATAKGKSFDH